MTEEDATSQERQLSQDLAAYAGRWVALAGDQVAGVGDTAMAAERFGRRNRLRERLAVYFVEPQGGQPLALPEQLLELQSIFQGHDQPVHLVGGAVRDVLLGRPIKDLDFVVPEGAVRLAFKVANSLNLPAYILDRERDAGRVVLPDGETTLDFTCYRGAGLLEDLRSRDFTINAMALPVAAQTQASVIDPCAGMEDLTARLIRQTHPTAIEDDPVRAMRAARHAVDFQFAIEDKTRQAARRATTILDRVSIERIRDELLKMMRSNAPEEALGALIDLDLLPVVLPEIAALEGIPQTPPHYEGVLAHTGSVLHWISRVEELIYSNLPPAEPMLVEAYQCLEPYRQHLQEHIGRRLDGGVNGRQILRLGALFHDVGKAQTLTVEDSGRIRFFGHAGLGAKVAATRLIKLRFSREVVRHEKTLINGHMRPLLLAQNPTLSRRAIYRFFRDNGSAGLDITLLSLADHLATSSSGQSDPQWRRLLGVVSTLQEHYFERFNETVQPEVLLDGRSLMKILSIEPGPEIGRLLSMLAEAQAAGDVKTREQAVALVKSLATRDTR